MSPRAVSIAALGWAVALAPLAAFQWPTESNQIAATFGQSVLGVFHRGIDIAVSDAPVRPIEEGELVFCHEESKARLRSLPSGLGSFAVIHHAQKTAMRSVYGYLLETESPPLSSRKLVGRDDVLSRGGGSGIAQNGRILLIIEDVAAGELVNPLLVLPPVKDAVKPTIRNVELRQPGKALAAADTFRLSEGSWELSAEIFDPSDAGKSAAGMAPYKVAVYVNGKETSQVVFDTLKESKGELLVNPATEARYSAIYREDGAMRLGAVQFNKGITNIEIVVRDYGGNERIYSHQFRVP